MNEKKPDEVRFFYAPVRFRDFSPEGEMGHKKPRALRARFFPFSSYCYPHFGISEANRWAQLRIPKG